MIIVFDNTCNIGEIYKCVSYLDMSKDRTDPSRTLTYTTSAIWYIREVVKLPMVDWWEKMDRIRGSTLFVHWYDLKQGFDYDICS